MSIAIRDEEDIKAYFESFKTKYPELKAVKFVDVDEDSEEMTKNYFTNHYKGTVLFLGIYEHGFKLRDSLSYNYPHCQATILTRYDKKKPETIMAARKKTRVLMTKILHSINHDALDSRDGEMGFDSAQPDNRYDPTAGYHWTFKLSNDLMLPIGDIANCGCRGWSIDFEMGFPVTEVI